MAATESRSHREQLITGYRQLIRLARAEGLLITGGTLLPYRGAPFYSERCATAGRSWRRRRHAPPSGPTEILARCAAGGGEQGTRNW
ncbi:hypothetical protein OHA40_29295 [Nocardia sp. NBC_00508]|uniref:hypothetical protein n=1 Tax=Nocardia sp. NBC_00508 TaxID=2975992 RepID=UPI002E819713|nr:hypothetical protein [Nocardia sp. NBC_00508]WUD65670.1 hypothetical protein OHA40_29295 [Nocardia sp. NBC_00508]